MTSIRTNINHLMLEWARKEAGFSKEQASEALNIRIETLEQAEKGNHRLTINQLKTASRVYNCPYGYFYLKSPPHEVTFNPVPDYRTAPGMIGKDHFRLQLEIKKYRDKRDEYLDLAKSLGKEIGEFKQEPVKEIVTLAKRIRERLDVSDAEISKLNFQQVYPYWKSKIESDHVLVFESQYIPKDSGVIGAAIYYESYPIILIKRGPDNNARKLFTLLHEYAHLIRGVSAINDLYSLTTEQPADEDKNIEAECNLIAAEILAPTKKMQAFNLGGISANEKMERLARNLKITYSTAAMCLHRHHLISKRELNQLLELRRRLNDAKKKSKDDDARIPREIIMKLDLGKPFFNLALGAYSSGVIDVFDTSKILNLRVNKIDKLLGNAS